jgi:hypothetical protein
MVLRIAYIVSNVIVPVLNVMEKHNIIVPNVL